jgi:branched-subunit amino acid transport protein
MSALEAVLALAAVCWAYRVMFIVIVPADRLPAQARRALGHLAPAVLAALIAVEVSHATVGSEPLVALLVLASVAAIALVVRVTRSMALAVSLGLVAALVIDLVVLG